MKPHYVCFSFGKGWRSGTPYREISVFVEPLRLRSCSRPENEVWLRIQGARGEAGLTMSETAAFHLAMDLLENLPTLPVGLVLTEMKRVCAQQGALYKALHPELFK